MRKVFIAILALAAGFGTAVLPELASSAATPASITATDYHFVGPGGSAATVTVSVGDSVAFAYPSGSSSHNVDFPNRSPTSCSQTAGSSSGSVPPLPAKPTSAGWSGTCLFSAAGTYSFHCDMHSFMTGSVVVQPAAPTPTATATNPTTTTATTTTTTIDTQPTTTTTAGTPTTATTTTGSTSSTTTSTPSSTTPPPTVSTSTSAQPPVRAPGGGTTHSNQRRSGLVLILPRHQTRATIRFTVRHGRPREVVTGVVRLGRRVIMRVRLRIGAAGSKNITLKLPVGIRRHLRRGQVLKLTFELHSAAGSRKVLFSLPS